MYVTTAAEESIGTYGTLSHDADDADTKSVSLTTADGKSLGFKLRKASSGGVAIKSLDAGGQAESLGTINVGDVIVKINGTDVSAMSNMMDIGKLIKASLDPRCSFRTWLIIIVVHY